MGAFCIGSAIIAAILWFLKKRGEEQQTYLCKKDRNGFAYVRHNINVMPEHPLTPYNGESGTCKICGLEHGKMKDLSLEWYSRMTSGTPLDGDPAGHVYAFREMEKEKMIPSPNEYDRWAFRAVLTVLRRLPPKTRYSGAIETLKKENLLPLKIIRMARC